MNDNIICPKCGVKNKRNAHHCFFCGKYFDFEILNQAPVEGATGKKYNILVFIILLCFSLAVLATLGLYAFFISLTISLSYLIFGNTKMFKKILTVVCILLGIVFVLVIVFVVGVIILFFVELNRRFLV